MLNLLRKMFFNLLEKNFTNFNILETRRFRINEFSHFQALFKPSLIIKVVKLSREFKALLIKFVLY